MGPRSVAVRFALITSTFIGFARADGPLPAIDVRTFRPSPDPRAQLAYEPATVLPKWRWSIGGWGAFAFHPLRLRTLLGDTKFIERQAQFDATAAIGLGSGVAVGLSLPVIIFQEGDEVGGPSGSARVPTTALGDLAVAGKASLIDNTNGGFGLGAAGIVGIPTGDRSSGASDGSLTTSARLIADYNFIVAGFQATLGFTARTAERAWTGVTTIGNEVPWSASIRIKPAALGFFGRVDTEGRHTLVLGARGALPAGPVGPFGAGIAGSALLSPVIASLSDRVEIGHHRDLFLVAGVDVGLNDAIGAPAFRGLLGLSWSPSKHDADDDGVDDDVDQCPDIAEDRDGFEDSDGCPDIDDDEDGILDSEDACPKVKGVPSDGTGRNGCPLQQASAEPANPREL